MQKISTILAIIFALMVITPSLAIAKHITSDGRCGFYTPDEYISSDDRGGFYTNDF